MELRNLNTFVRAADAGSFSRAASELGYTQSTVTAQIQGLEEELGVQLTMAFRPPYSEKPLITFPKPQTVEKAIKARLYHSIFFSPVCVSISFLLVL